MRKIKEVLRMHSLGLTQSQIARSCSIGQSTVSEYLKASEAAGIEWPVAADWDESRLAAALLPKHPPTNPAVRHPAPEFAAIHLDLQKHKRKRTCNPRSVQREADQRAGVRRAAWLSVCVFRAKAIRVPG